MPVEFQRMCHHIPHDAIGISPIYTAQGIEISNVLEYDRGCDVTSSWRFRDCVINTNYSLGLPTNSMVFNIQNGEIPRVSPPTIFPTQPIFFLLKSSSGLG